MFRQTKALKRQINITVLLIKSKIMTMRVNGLTISDIVQVSLCVYVPNESTIETYNKHI